LLNVYFCIQKSPIITFGL